jgi:hypothetical protein
MDDAHEFGSGLRAHLGFEHEAPVRADRIREPVAEPDPREEELARRLAYLAAAEEALVARERQVAERERDVEARETELEQHVVQAAVDVRQLLRRRAEQQADGLWRSFEEALHATTPGGEADHAVRVAAARALLAEAYDGDAGGQALDDELARLRARRTATGP